MCESIGYEARRRRWWNPGNGGHATRADYRRRLLGGPLASRTETSLTALSLSYANLNKLYEQKSHHTPEQRRQVSQNYRESTPHQRDTRTRWPDVLENSYAYDSVCIYVRFGYNVHHQPFMGVIKARKKSKTNVKLIDER